MEEEEIARLTIRVSPAPTAPAERAGAGGALPARACRQQGEAFQAGLEEGVFVG